MSGGGIVASIGRVLGYILAIALAASIITVIAVTFLQPQAQEPQEIASAAMRSVRSVIDRIRGQGSVVGRAVAGMDPPSIADRLASVESTRLVTTPAQEVIMTGATDHICLGGEKEVMLEVKNDIGAEQLDIGYAIETLGSPVVKPPRVTTVASCGPESLVKQCIPLPPAGKGVILTTLAYYESNRQETRIYPKLLDTEALKATGKIELNASEFQPLVVADQ